VVEEKVPEEESLQRGLERFIKIRTQDEIRININNIFLKNKIDLPNYPLE